MRQGLKLVALAAFALALLFGGVLASAMPAGAATVDDCQGQITALQVATSEAEFTGQNAAKNQAGLLGKLEAASDALDAGKNADAIQKLTDFRTKVVTLNEQGKINPTDAADLIARADAAIACIQSIGA
jgi:hypothetical protein